MKLWNLSKTDFGVIMMETIITLPLYIILLACVFWLGETCMIRLTLTNGENVQLWERSSQHAIVQLNERDIFWNFSPVNNADIVSGAGGMAFVSTNGANVGWGQVRSGRSSLNTRRSNWSYDADSSANYIMNNNLSSHTTQPMAARGTVENPLMSFLLSRQSYTGRTGIYTTLKSGDDDAWKNEYLASWTLNSAEGNYNIIPDSGGDYKEVDSYNGGERNDSYVEWSE